MDGRPVAEVIALEAIGEGYWVHRPGLARGGRVDVARGIRGADRERVRTVNEGAVTHWRGAQAKRPPVQRALERRPRLVRGKGKAGQPAAHVPARAGSDGCLLGSRVDRPAPGCGRRLGVAGRIGCLDSEGVRAVAQATQASRRGARSKGRTVEPALEG